jgi:multiple antibiotic resistance protein
VLTNVAAQTGSFLLLAFPALFSIINPLGGAFVFLAATREFSTESRTRLARQVATYSFITLNVSMLVGAFVLRIFGIEMPVLRLAGGIIIALTAWRLLNAEDTSARRGAVLEEAGARDASHLAFYPLTMPMTTGPGTIAVAIALGTGGGGPGADNPLVFAFQALVTSTLICLLIYFLYRSSNRIALAIGPTGTNIVARLSAFLLFCIGIQVMWSGIAGLVRSLQQT